MAFLLGILCNYFDTERVEYYFDHTVTGTFRHCEPTHPLVHEMQVARV